MRVLLALLLVGIAGCGGNDDSPDDVVVPTPKSSQAKTNKLPAQTDDADPIAALEKIGAKIKRSDGYDSEQGEVVEVDFDTTTDAELVHLEGRAGLQEFNLIGLRFTDAGLVYLKGLTRLERLYLDDTKTTDAGVANLQKSLPNCTISWQPSSRLRPPTR